MFTPIMNTTTDTPAEIPATFRAADPRPVHPTPNERDQCDDHTGKTDQRYRGTHREPPSSNQVTRVGATRSGTFLSALGSMLCTSAQLAHD